MSQIENTLETHKPKHLFTDKGYASGKNRKTLREKTTQKNQQRPLSCHFLGF